MLSTIRAPTLVVAGGLVGNTRSRLLPHQQRRERWSGSVGQDKDSLPRQRQAIEAYASANGIEIVREFYDAAVRGADHIDARPGFAELVAYMNGNGARTILVESAFRFARDLVVQETGYAWLKREGFTLIAVDDPDAFTADTPTAVLIRQILGAVSQFEKASLVSKLKGARDRAAKKAGGYRVEGKSYARHRPELLTALQELRTGDPGATLQQLADRLAARGILTDRGKPLARQAVHRTLAQMRGA